jgi:hypothetical protein
VSKKFDFDDACMAFTEEMLSDAALCSPDLGAIARGLSGGLSGSTENVNLKGGLIAAS